MMMEVPSPSNVQIESGQTTTESDLGRPSLLELVALWGLSCALFVAVILHFQSYSTKVDQFGDSSAYMAAARAIRHWDFRGVMVKQFWGVSYAAAGVSRLSGCSDRTALLMVCGVSSFASVLLVFKLWGPWVAGFFAAINFDWVQRSFLGGSESLFVGLLFFSFWSTRKDRWIWASLCAAFATVVRPLGIFALLAIGIVLLSRREYRKVGTSTGLALMVGALYLLPFLLYFHDPLFQEHRYKTSDWHSGSVIGAPFQAIAMSSLRSPGPWTNMVLTLGW